jgi:hypothetical protein
MAADKTFEVLLKTTADRTGALQTKADLEDVKNEAGSTGSNGKGTDIDRVLRDAGLRKETLATETAITVEAKAQGAASAAAAAASELHGVNIARAEQAAGRLTRQLVSGGDVTRSLGGLLAELAPALAPAALGVLALYETLKATNFAAQTLGELFGGFSIGDLASGFNPTALLDEVAAAEDLKRLIRDINKESLSQQEASIEKLGDKVQDLTQKYREQVVAFEGLLEPITGANANLLTNSAAQIRILQAELNLRQLHLENSRLEVALESGKTAELERQSEVLKSQIAIQGQQTRLAGEFKSTLEAGFSSSDKIDLFKTRIGEIQRQLKNLGVDAETPNQAFQKGIGLSDAQRVKIDQLAAAWQRLKGDIKQTQDAEAAAAAAGKASADEKIAILQRLAQLGDASAQGKIDKLLDIKPPSATDATKAFYERILADATATVAEIQNAKANLQLILDRQLRALEGPAQKPAGTLSDSLDALQKKSTTIAPPTTPPGEASASAGAGVGAGASIAADKAAAITAAVNQVAQQIGQVLEASAAGIPLSFTPVAQAIQTDIPQAIERGTAALAVAVVNSVGAIDAKFAAALERVRASLQSQINGLG